MAERRSAFPPDAASDGTEPSGDGEKYRDGARLRDTGRSCGLTRSRAAAKSRDDVRCCGAVGAGVDGIR